MNTIAGVDVREIVERFGDSVYVYDKQRIEDNYKRFSEAFKSNYPKVKVFFSVKSNSNLAILKLFKSLGAGADCSSPFEVMLAQKAGFADEDIIYTGNYESEDDLQFLASTNVTVNFDSIDAFDEYRKYKKSEFASFRINPGIGKGGFEGITTGGADAKFGIPYEFAKSAFEYAESQGISRFGVHMMTGSNNLEPYFFSEITEKLMSIASKIFKEHKPEYFDIGGGYGVPYEDDEPELDIELTAKLVTEAFTEKCLKYGFGQPYLYLEPGRYLIADAGFLITKVSTVKSAYKKFIGLSSGMNTLMRPDLYGANHKITIYGKETNTQFSTICGPICENSDIFARHLPTPKIEKGDLVVIHTAGAYGYSMASNYNSRPRPAEVLIDNGELSLIRRKDSFEDLLKNYE